MDENTIRAFFESTSFPTALFAKRVGIPKDRLSGARGGRELLSWVEVRRLAKAGAPKGAPGAEIDRLCDLVWDLSHAAVARRIKSDKEEARMSLDATGGAP